MITANPSTSAAATPDFVVLGGGSVYLVDPRTNTAREHLRQVVGEEAQFLGGAVAVEHRYISTFVLALAEDGFTVAGEADHA